MWCDYYPGTLPIGRPPGATGHGRRPAAGWQKPLIYIASLWRFDFPRGAWPGNSNRDRDGDGDRDDKEGEQEGDRPEEGRGTRDSEGGRSQGMVVTGRGAGKCP